MGFDRVSVERIGWDGWGGTDGTDGMDAIHWMESITALRLLLEHLWCLYNEYLIGASS